MKKRNRTLADCDRRTQGSDKQVSYLDRVSTRDPGISPETEIYLRKRRAGKGQRKSLVAPVQ